MIDTKGTTTNKNKKKNKRKKQKAKDLSQKNTIENHNKVRLFHLFLLEMLVFMKCIFYYKQHVLKKSIRVTATHIQ